MELRLTQLPWSQQLPLRMLRSMTVSPFREIQRLFTEVLFTAPPTQTLYGLTHQLSSLHKLLSTRLLDARTPLKELRNLQTEIEDREVK
jgi:hypothetical protein